MPETFGRYELLDVLGRGGMGIVWRAHDTVRQRNVALKVLPEHLAGDAEFSARFRRESRLAAQLNEPHIIPIHDFGEIDGRLFIDMRLVEGVDLGTVLDQRGRLAPTLAVDILTQVGSALDAAHADGLVHRDVKPGNVMLTGVTPDLRRTPFAYLVDFGIARSTESRMTFATKTSAATIGTVAYMAPERIAGEPGEARSDVYALSCMLYETVTGRLPFEGESFAVLYKHMNDPVPRARDLVPGVPAALDAVIAKGMAKAAQDRYAGAGDFMQAAQDALRSTQGATEIGRPGAETDDETYRVPVPPPSTPLPSNPRPWTPLPPAAPPWTPLPSTPPLFTPLPSTRPGAPPPTEAPPPPGPGSPFRPVPAARRRRRGLIAVVAAVVIAALVVLGVVLISGSGGHGTPAADSSGRSGTPRDSSAGVVGDINPTPRSAVTTGGTLTWALTAPITNFNVYSTDGNTAESDLVMGALLPQPFHFGATGVASVDTDYFTSITQVSSDPLKIEYKINPKAKWDDGTKISYQDFADLAQAMVGTSNRYDAYTSTGWDRISSVTSGTNAQDVLVSFRQPFSDWRRLFSPLIPSSLTGSPDSFDNAWAKKPLKTAGPFRFDTSPSGGPYTVVRNPKWWGDPAKLDRISFAVYADQSAAIAALGAGKVNYAQLGGINAEANVATVSGFRGADIRQYAAGTTYRLLSFNTNDPLLSDLRVRQAIAHATDRATITSSLIGKLGGRPTPLQNYFYLQRSDGYQSTCGGFCDYDIAKAKSILEAEGWKLDGSYYAMNGQTLTVSLTIPTGAANAASEADLLRTSLKAAGIRLTIVSLKPSEVAKRLSAGQFQLTTTTRVATQFPVSDDVEFYRYARDNRSNYGQGGSPAINDLLDDALSSGDASAAHTLVNQLSTAMWSNASWLPLYERPQIAGVTGSLANVGAPGLGDVHYQDIGYTS